MNGVTDEMDCLQPHPIHSKQALLMVHTIGCSSGAEVSNWGECQRQLFVTQVRCGSLLALFGHSFCFRSVMATLDVMIRRIRSYLRIFLTLNCIMNIRSCDFNRILEHRGLLLRRTSTSMIGLKPFQPHSFGSKVKLNCPFLPL